MAPAVRSVRPASLNGIEDCHDLRELRVRPYRVPSLAPLQDLKLLERIELIGPRAVPADNDLDLDHLGAVQHFRTLALVSAGNIRSLAPLQRLPHFRELRLNEVAVTDGDLTPLFQLPSWVQITGPTKLLDDSRHYSHSVRQLRELARRG